MKWNRYQMVFKLRKGAEEFYKGIHEFHFEIFVFKQMEKATEKEEEEEEMESF